jgi:RNA polymerase sigma factor (sigma-70 family)
MRHAVPRLFHVELSRPFVRRRFPANMSPVVRPDRASTAPSDAALLRQYVRERDDAAFGRVVGRHMRAVRHVAYRYTHHRQAAEDVAQAAFLVMAQRPRQAMRSAKWKRSALPWLAKVARYAAANWRRAEERRHRHETRAAAHETAHYDPTAGVELAEAVRSALACLPRRDRRIVEWRHLSQMPWDEVARHAGTTPEAARKAGTRALSQLRTILERRGVTAGVGVIGATLAALSRPAAALSAPLAIELARKVILMARIKTASALTAVAATVFIGGAIVSNATGGQENGLRTAQNPAGGQDDESRTARRVQATDPTTQPVAHRNPLRMRLGSEAELEVVAISDGEKFWTGHGVELEQPAFDVPREVPAMEGMRRVFAKFTVIGEIARGELPAELAGEIDGPMDGRIRLGANMTGMSFQPRDPADKDGRTLLMWWNVPLGQPVNTIELHVAAGPWSLHRLVPYDDGMLGTENYITEGILPNGWLTVTPVGGVRNAPDRSQLSVMTNQTAVEVRPIVQDMQGQWHAMTGGGFPMGADFFVRTYVADVRPEDIGSVAVVTRGVYQVRLNLVLLPEPQPLQRMIGSVTPPPRSADRQPEDQLRDE